MDWNGCEQVERVPGRLSAQPVLKDTRVTLEAVVESYEFGESVEDVVYKHDLDPNQIIALLAFVGISPSLKSE